MADVMCMVRGSLDVIVKLLIKNVNIHIMLTYIMDWSVTNII